MRKSRRIHLDYALCQSLAGSTEGIVPLVTPSLVKTSSRDPHGGLYPVRRVRMSRRNPAVAGSSQEASTSTSAGSSFPSFRTAASLLPAGSSTSSDPSTSKRGNGSPAKAKRPKFAPQGNKITGYFESSPKKSCCSPDHKELQFPPLACLTAADAASGCSTLVDCSVTGDSDSASSDSVIITDVFGLVGSSDHRCDSKAGEDFFERLPSEILENILAYVSLQELLLSCVHVCSRWNAVIRNPLFLQHRKRYHKYKSGLCCTTLADVQGTCESASMNSTKTCLPGLIRFMLHFRKDAKKLEQRLSRHAKFKMAMELLRKCFPDCFIGKFAHPWCIVAALVILSEAVGDIFWLFHSTVDNLAVSEALYCIATLLMHFQATYRINHGFHYRVYYALHLFESTWSGTLKDLTAVHQSQRGQQNILRFGLSSRNVKYTHEQMRIVNHELGPKDIVRIIAFAGTGKTSTLVEYARLRPSMSFLCVVYNKSVSEVAKSTFPPNVECRTAHSLAYRTVGFRYRDKMATKLRALDVSRMVSPPSGLALNKQRFAKLVIQSVEGFMASTDPLLTSAHVPERTLDLESNLVVHLSWSQRMAIGEAAADLWERMVDPDNKEVRITHDGYLKKFQLQKPSLGRYDCIFVDEAQDCNPAMLDFILAQPCPKILVGDPHQQIYAFRRAIDALSSVRATHTFYLTKSFRFGPEIGYVASCALEVLKGVSNKTIVGSAEEGKVDGSKAGQIAVIARANLTLFNTAVEIVCNGHYRELGLTHVNGAFVGGLRGYGFQQILDIYRLMSKSEEGNNLIKDPFVRRFESFAKLRSYARNAEDKDLFGKIMFVETHQHQIPMYIRTLEMKCAGNEKLANVVFTTAHKAKGLEFDTVLLTDDFYAGSLDTDDSRTFQVHRSEASIQEYNILYVAMTRAKKCLCLSRAAYSFLLLGQEKFEYLRAKKDVLCDTGAALTCCSCEQPIEASGDLVLYRTPLCVGRLRLAGGTLCKSCAMDPGFEYPFDIAGFPVTLEDLGHVSLSSIFEVIL